jgi:hypothetical protein
MSPRHPFLVFDDLRGEFVLAHRRDYIVGKLCPCADLIDAFLNLGVQFAMLPVVDIPPTSLVEGAPLVNQL